MNNIFIGGGKNNASKILNIAPLIISLIFVIISVGTMPGTIGNKTKYVKKDDTESELKLSDVAIPVSLLSFTIVLIIISIALNMNNISDYVNSESF